MEFVKPIADSCVFMSADFVCLIYVDNALLFYENKLTMELLKQKMRDDGMLFCDKDSVAGYLGVHINSREDSTIHLTQMGLTHCMVEKKHLNDKTVDAVDTPCTKFLPLDKFEVLFTENSVIPPLLCNLIIYKDIQDLILLWQLCSVHVTFVTQNSLKN